MNSVVIILIALAVLMLLSLSCLVLIMWRLLAEQSKATQSSNEVLSKAIALLAAKNLESYQGIQVMESSQSSILDEDADDFGEPVGNEEADRLYAKHMRGDRLTDGEQSRFDRIFVGPLG